MNIHEQKLTELLKSEIPVLFLGAGFSYEARNKYGFIPMNKELCKLLIQDFLKFDSSHKHYKEISSYNLQDLYTYAMREKSEREIKKYIISLFKNIRPNSYHYKLKKYPWSKIYTTNIDDLVENIYKSNELVVQNEYNQKNINSETIEYIKLHGCVNKPEYDFVFSGKHYINSIVSNEDYRLNNLVFDMQRENIIFVGTNFNEIDIDYYLTKYEKAGYSSAKGKLFFISPSPSLQLQGRINDLNGILIKWDTKQFLDFIENIKYNPEEYILAQKRMKHLGFFSILELRDIYSTKARYRSKLYEGYDCKWEDIFDEWDFELNQHAEIIKRINSFKTSKESVLCISIYSKPFNGKSTLLKRLGITMDKMKYNCYEFIGKEFNAYKFIEYINSYESSQFITLLIDDGFYYYTQIERILKTNFSGKKIIIITTSREYYHNKRKYYLQGNNFFEIEIPLKVNYNLANNIQSKLKEKGYLGVLTKSKTFKDQVKILMQQSDLMSCLLFTTKGKKFIEKINKEVDIALEGNHVLKKLFLILTIFDYTDIPELPFEILPVMFQYSIDEICDIPNVEGLLKKGHTGIAFRNRYIVESVYNIYNASQVVDIINEVLMVISPQVIETKYSYWKNIFESLTSVDNLIYHLHLKVHEIKFMLYNIQKNYENISYYWLQLGITEQKSNDFSSAYNHLVQAQSIRPSSYQIRHSIGRNYLKEANYMNNSKEAQKIFSEGERILIDLINDPKQSNAVMYSIHSYIHEKIKFMKKFNVLLSSNDKKRMFKFMKTMIQRIGIDEIMTKDIVKTFFEFIVYRNETLNFNTSDLIEDKLFSQYMKLKTRDL